MAAYFSRSEHSTRVSGRELSRQSPFGRLGYFTFDLLAFLETASLPNSQPFII